jgi:CelD/BcsL family acetyltransferase involved in cellulose biosynthesis
MSPPTSPLDHGTVMVRPTSEPTRLVRIDLDDPAWANHVANDPHALPFHHPAWAQTLAECYRFRTFGLALTDFDGQLIAGLPVVERRGLFGGRRWISLPFTDVCPPLVGGDSHLQARLEVEIDAARREAGVGCVELRASPASSSAVAFDGGLRHTLQLDHDPETVYRRFKPKQVRHAIRYAERSGVIVSRAEREEDLCRTFYALHTATRRRLGVPVQPRRYFSLLWRRIVEPGLGFVLVARVRERPVAAAVFLAWNGTVVYKYSASDASAWNLRPNNAVLWHAMRWGCENGYSTFDFGRTDRANEGLRMFKRGWGAEEQPLPYASIGHAQAQSLGAGPVAGLGRAVIRRSPSFVCRAIGEALYRYAA